PARGPPPAAAPPRRPFLELTQGPLDSSLARAERRRERRGRPRLATLEQGEDGAGGAVDGRRQHDDSAPADGDEGEAARGRLDPGERAHRRPQAAELDAESGAVRLVGGMRFEGALDEVIAWHVGRPRLGEGAGEGERDRATAEGIRSSGPTHRPATGIDDEIAGPEEGFDLVEAN